MTHVERPGLALFHRCTETVAEHRECLAEAVWRVFRHLNGGEGASDNCVEFGGILIGLAGQALDGKPVCATFDERFGKERVFGAEELCLTKICHPRREAYKVVAVNREERRVDGLGVFGVHLAGVLEDVAVKEVDVFEPK